MITDFKLQGTTSLVSVALLTGLCCQDVGTNLLHLLFCLYHNIGAKDNSLALLGSTQWGTIGSSIEYFKM
jgi:hypothetical protein